MTEEGKKFLERYTITSEGINSSNLKEAIGEFRGLGIEDQYDILCDEAYGRFKTRVNWLFKNNGRDDRGTGIIEILNHKFPAGIEITIDSLKREIPYELYSKLLKYEPHEDGKHGWVKLVENTNIFKDQNGKIDANKIVEYLSDPYLNINGHDYCILFEYLDPDENRKRHNENYRRKTSI